MKLASFRMRLRLQSNGQVGVFPEHQNYLGPLLGVLEELSAGRQGPIRVLNLFAYTGMASLLCRGAGAEVCHVDLSKRSIEWVRQNLECNGLSDGVRLIREDAAKFLQREVRRESKYDVIIADPPSFSRVSKAKHWTIEDVLPGLISSCRGCLESEKGLFVLTSHSTFPLEVYYNLVTDIFTDHDFTTIGRSLSLREQGVQRALPSGYLVASGCGIGCMSAFAT